jgi:hypothetical protein
MNIQRFPLGGLSLRQRANPPVSSRFPTEGEILLPFQAKLPSGTSDSVLNPKIFAASSFEVEICLSVEIRRDVRRFLSLQDSSFILNPL